MPAEPDEKRVRFGLLGSLEVWSGEERVPLGGRVRQRVLAVLLLHANHVVPISRLVEVAWEAEPPATAEHQIRKTVANLRTRLPYGSELLVTDGPGYRMVLTDDQLDVRIFEVRLRRAREALADGLVSNAVAQLQAALDLWRGPVMDGHDSSIIGAAAHGLAERRLTAIEHLVDLKLESGDDVRTVLDMLVPLVVEHPLRENLRGQLMLALYRSGRQTEALETFESFRRQLADQLGVDPGRELLQLHERILRGSSDLHVPPPTRASELERFIPRPLSLPRDLPDFVGREREIGILTALAAEDAGRSARIIAVDGMGGVGKTSLAVHVAHMLADRHPDGQIYIDLRGFTPGEQPLAPEDALHTMLAGIGMPRRQIPDDLASRVALWRSVVADRRLLVLLDNASSSAQVRDLLPGTAGCLVLVTSRARLTALDGVDVLSVDLFTPAESRALLDTLLRPERLAAEPSMVVALIDSCGRMPLALRIAAARLGNRPQWTVADVVRRLAEGVRAVGVLSAGDRSVAVTIGLSYEAMDSLHRRAFRRLAAHPGIDLEVYSAAALLGTSPARAEHVMEDLLDMHLLRQNAPGRWTFHDLVRGYAQTMRDSTEQAQEYRDAIGHVLDFYLLAADRAAEVLQPGRQRFPLSLAHDDRPALPPIADAGAALAWLDGECGNILRATRTAFQEDLRPHAIHLSRALIPYLRSHGLVRDEVDLLQRAVTAAREIGDRTLERLSLMNLSTSYGYVGRWQDSLRQVTAALDIAVADGDRRGEADCLNRLAVLHNALGDYQEGLRVQDEASNIQRDLDSPRGEHTSLIAASSAHMLLGRPEEALAAADQAVDISRRLGGPGDEMTGLVTRADALLGMDDVEGALSNLVLALRLAEQTGALDGQALVLTRRADVYRRIRRFDEAMDQAKQAFDLATRAGQPAGAVAAENLIGAIHTDLGEPLSALATHQQALEVAERIGYRIEVARALSGMGHASWEIGDRQAARRYWKAALDHFSEMGALEGDQLPGTAEDAPG